MSTWGVASLDQEIPREIPLRERSSFFQPQPVNHERPLGGCAEGPKEGNIIYARDVLLQGLEQAYVFESRVDVQAFLRPRPTSIALLAEASAHIDEAFGQGRTKIVRLVYDDSGATSVFGIVAWPESLEAGREALARFDQSWWLRNCNRADGAVNFNIELI